MIVVMRSGATAAQIADVLRRVETEGLRAHLSRGEERTVIGVIGDERTVDGRRWEALEGVEKVLPVTQPFKLASREFKPDKTLVELDGVTIGGDEVVVMAGPCSVENEKQIMETAQAVKAAGATILRGGAFKPRTSPYDFQGMDGEGLEAAREGARGDRPAHRHRGHERPRRGSGRPSTPTSCRLVRATCRTSRC